MTNQQLLSQVPLFSALPEAELDQLAQSLVSQNFADGELLFREGDSGDRLTIITAGEVEVIKAMGTPDERVLAVLKTGEILGEMSLVYGSQQRSASARARGPARVLEMTRDDFYAMLNRSSHLAFKVMQEMSDRLRNSEDLTIRDLREKNHQLLNAYVMLKNAQEQLINQEKMEHELKMARQIQQHYLPKELPSLPGWKVAAHWQPAREVSGDFYDFIPFPGDKLGILIGDVTGKGVPAALVMATTRSVLRAVALTAAEGEPVSPGSLLERINNALCPDMPQMMFVTCLFGVLDPQAGQFCFANAGHPLPYQRTAAGVLQPSAAGMPLGLMPEMKYAERTVTLGPGEGLLLYSDGLVEAHNDQGGMFSFERLRGLMGGTETGTELIHLLLQRLGEFTGEGAEQEDDVTLVWLERV